jgi:hypothetical protein
MEIVAADKRGRRRLIPDVTIPPPVAGFFRGKLVAAADQLNAAAGKPDSATGAVERLVILEQLMAHLDDLRALLTAWTVETDMGEAPIEEVARRIGKSGTTVSRRYDEQHIRRLQTLR